jgi:hypothetical protein
VGRVRLRVPIVDVDRTVLGTWAMLDRHPRKPIRAARIGAFGKEP